MAEPHAQSVRAAERTARRLLDLFRRLGAGPHPRGAILSAYRRALGLLRTSGLSIAQLLIVLDALRGQLAEALRGELFTALELGQEQGAQMLAAYGLPVTTLRYQGELLEQGLRGAMAVYDDQAERVRVGLLTGVIDRDALLGDASRAGVLSAATMLTEATRWATALATAGSEGVVRDALVRTGTDGRFMRQAIAAIDERTTDCCLRVNGQVVEIENAFTLMGTPRFADKMMQPPFHYYCRTAVALVRQDDTEDGVTRAMRDASDAELQARGAAKAQQERLERELAELGAKPDVRIRRADSDAVRKLRDELRMWRERERVEIHPAYSASRRGQSE